MVDDFKSISYSLSNKHLPCSSWAWGLAVRFQSGYGSLQGQEACVSCLFSRRGGGCTGELRAGPHSHSSGGEQVASGLGCPGGTSGLTLPLHCLVWRRCSLHSKRALPPRLMDNPDTGSTGHILKQTVLHPTVLERTLTLTIPVFIMLLLLLSCFRRVRPCATPEMAAHQAPPSLGFSKQEHRSGLPFPSPVHESEKWKWSLSRVRLLATPWTAAHQAPPSMGFSRQEYWSGVPLPSLS